MGYIAPPEWAQDVYFLRAGGQIVQEPLPLSPLRAAKLAYARTCAWVNFHLPSWVAQSVFLRHPFAWYYRPVRIVWIARDGQVIRQVKRP